MNPVKGRDFGCPVSSPLSPKSPSQYSSTINVSMNDLGDLVNLQFLFDSLGLG